MMSCESRDELNPILCALYYDKHIGDKGDKGMVGDKGEKGEQGKIMRRD